jgi:hypothetical protein
MPAQCVHHDAPNFTTTSLPFVEVCAAIIESNASSPRTAPKLPPRAGRSADGGRSGICIARIAAGETWPGAAPCDARRGSSYAGTLGGGSDTIERNTA